MNNINHEEDKLIEQLKQEADASRPGFSVDLHAKICDAIDAEVQRPSLLPTPVVKMPRYTWQVLATIASTVAVVAIAWLAISSYLGPDTAPLPNPGNNPIVQTPVTPDLPAPEPAIAEADAEALAALQDLMASTTQAPGKLGNEMTTMLAEKENALSIERINFSGDRLFDHFPNFVP